MNKHDTTDPLMKTLQKLRKKTPEYPPEKLARQRKLFILRILEAIVRKLRGK